MKLTDKKIKNAKPKEKPYKLFDGKGLYLEVMPSGSKIFHYKYRYLGKETRISLGGYPLVSLADARDSHLEARKLLQKDINPTEHRQGRKREIVRNAATTFEALAREWHESQKSRWDEKHTANVLHRMEMDVFPYIGKRPIANIDTMELISTLKKIEARDALDMVARVRSIVTRVFRFAVQTGRCARNPALDLGGAFKTRKTEHFAAIETDEIPDLIHKLERNEQRLFPSTLRLITFSLHTFVRPGEARQARWDEINFEKSQWEIPAERMKMRRPHIVPLSQQILRLLEDQKKQFGHMNTPWVFSSPITPKNPMSDGAVLVALKRMGYAGKMTAHGFRALARTAIREELEYEPDIIEQQLAHKAAGVLGEAYDRSRFLKQRKQLMQDWSDYLDKAASKGKVITGKFKKA